MPLRRTMPTRDPERAAREPQHSRGYSPSRGGWTRPAEPETKTGEPRRGRR